MRHRMCEHVGLTAPDCFETVKTATNPLRPFPLISRIGAAILGGYAFCWGFVAVGLAGLYAAGLSFHDAEHLIGILVVLLYLAIFCWTFAARRLRRLWLTLLGGGALMAGLAALLQRAAL